MMRLDGLKILITAGPTIEKIDPVRFISNASSGKMGKSLVEAALHFGAEVTLIHGPISVSIDCQGFEDRFEKILIESALEMHEEVQKKLLNFDVLIMAAAVADYRPQKTQSKKIKKDQEQIEIQLIKNPDILAEASLLRREKVMPILVGFALETHDVESYAKKKLVSKKVDLIIANEAQDSLGKETNKVAFISKEKVQWTHSKSKKEIAKEILEQIKKIASTRMLS